MADLLEQETAAYPEMRRGEIIEGIVVGSERDGILVDIGAKSEGVIPPQEMHCLQPEGASKLQHGDKVLVFIVQPESPEGQIILSLDRARGERGWRVLQDYLDANQAFEGHVTGSNKGGLLVNVEGVNAFVPLSQLVAGPERSSPENTQRALTEWVGKPITLKVIELNRRRNRAILSERAAVQERRAAEKERLLLELTEGDIRDGVITSIRDFGIFVDIGGADGLVHLSELSWERTPKSPHELFRVGQEVAVHVLKIDHEAKKIALSVRRAQPERWEEIVSGYREGQVVPGQVTKLAPFGAFVRLEGPVEGLIHISELVDRRINHPREVVQENDVVPVKIVRIEYDRHRLGLSLRQARDSAENDGWAFSEMGAVTTAPQDALDRLGVTAPVRPPEPDGMPGEEQARDEVAAEAEGQSVEDVVVEREAPDVDAAPDAAADVAEVEAVVVAEPAQTAEDDAATEVQTEPSVGIATAEIPEPEVDEPAPEAEAESEPEVETEVEEPEPAPDVEPPAASESETQEDVPMELEPAIEDVAEVVDSPAEDMESSSEVETVSSIETEAEAEDEPVAEPESEPEPEPAADVEPSAASESEAQEDVPLEPEAVIEDVAEAIDSPAEDVESLSEVETVSSIETEEDGESVTDEPAEALNTVEEN